MPRSLVGVFLAALLPVVGIVQAAPLYYTFEGPISIASAEFGTRGMATGGTARYVFQIDPGAVTISTTSWSAGECIPTGFFGTCSGTYRWREFAREDGAFSISYVGGDLVEGDPVPYDPTKPVSSPVLPFSPGQWGESHWYANSYYDAVVTTGCSWGFCSTSIDKASDVPYYQSFLNEAKLWTYLDTANLLLSRSFETTGDGSPTLPADYQRGALHPANWQVGDQFSASQSFLYGFEFVAESCAWYLNTVTGEWVQDCIPAHWSYQTASLTASVTLTGVSASNPLASATSSGSSGSGSAATVLPEPPVALLALPLVLVALGLGRGRPSSRHRGARPGAEGS